MSDAATIERAEVEAEADGTKEECKEETATGKAAEATAETEAGKEEAKDESKEEASKEAKEEAKEEETKEGAKEEAAGMEVDEEAVKEAEKPKEPEKPSELEEDAPEDSRPRLTGTVGYNTEDTTLNAMPTSKDKLLLHMSDGGFQHLIAGVRANVGIKAGRYMFELVILGNPPPSLGTAMPPKAPSQLVRVGFSTANSSLILGESEDGVCFDADGIYHHGKEKKRASQKFIRDQVIGILLNMDSASPNAYTMSIFRDGVRIAEPQPLPEKLRTQALFPAVSYKGAMLRLNFSGQPIKPLPFSCRMMQDIAEADSEVVVAAEPENGRYEVVFPVALPDEGSFEWVDQFLAKNPKYVELSHRTIIDWAVKSGLWRKGQSLNKGCNDKPEMGFGIPQLDDMSALRLLASLAPALPRNFLVAEVKGNLLPEMRKAIISRFTDFTKTAYVAMGEPTSDYKETMQAKLLEEKKHQATIEQKKRKNEAEVKKLIESKKAGKAAEPDEEAEVEDFDMEVNVELTEEEKQLAHPKKPMTDLLPMDLSKCFHRFSLPDAEEGFDTIRYDWADQDGCKEYLSSWILKRKATQRIEELQPGKYFREKSTEWQKASLDFKKKQMEWKKVLEQLQEWKTAGKAKGSDPKKAEDDKPTDIDPDDLDVFSVENVNDIGSGEPLYSNFEYEDWCLLAIRVELFLLVHGFRQDVDDAERQTFHESHLPFYYNRYWKKALDPKMYMRDTTSHIVALVKDTMEINAGNGMVEVKLPEDNPFDHFVKLAEEHRRERQRRLDAGDETAELKFRKPTPMPPAKAPGVGIAKAGKVVGPQHGRPFFQVAGRGPSGTVLKPVVVNPVKASTIGPPQSGKAPHIRPAIKAGQTGPIKPGITAGLKRPMVQGPKATGVIQPPTKTARTSFGGGAKW